MSEEKFKRLVKDGKTAVLVSHGFGAGWYTWNTEHLGMALDGDIAQAVLDGNPALAEKIAKERYGDPYTGGIDGLTVEWVPQGMKFEITEYDGSERLNIIDQTDYLVA